MVGTPGTKAAVVAAPMGGVLRGEGDPHRASDFLT
jgi:hypothetical protein